MSFEYLSIATSLVRSQVLFWINICKTDVSYGAFKFYGIG